MYIQNLIFLPHKGNKELPGETSRSHSLRPPCVYMPTTELHTGVLGQVSSHLCVSLGVRAASSGSSPSQDCLDLKRILSKPPACISSWAWTHGSLRERSRAHIHQNSYPPSVKMNSLLHRSIGNWIKRS